MTPFQKRKEVCSETTDHEDILKCAKNKQKFKWIVSSSTLKGRVVSNWGQMKLVSWLFKAIWMAIVTITILKSHLRYIVSVWARSSHSKLFQYHVVDSAAGTVQHESDPRSASSGGFPKWIFFCRVCIYVTYLTIVFGTFFTSLAFKVFLDHKP